MKHLSLIFIFFVIFQTMTFAQEEWTFDKCLDFALKHNITLKTEKLNSEITKSDYRQAYYNLLPSVAANGTHSYNYGKTIDQATYTYVNSNESGNINASLNLTVFSGFQEVRAIFRNKYAYNATIQDIEKVRIEISANLLNSFLMVLNYSELLQFSKNQYEVSKEQSVRTRMLYDMGKLSQNDYLNIKASEALDKEKLLIAENDYKHNFLLLTQLMNYDSIVSFRISKPENLMMDTTVLSIAYDQIYQKAEQQLPYLKSAEWRLKSAQKNLSVIKGALSPTLSVGYGYSSFYSQISANPGNIAGQPPLPYAYINQIKDNAGTQFYINLNIPIFDRFSRIGNIRKAKLNLSLAENQVNQTRQTLNKDLQKLYLDAQNSLAKYNTKKETMTAMDEIYKYSGEQFGLGLLSSLEYKIAKSSYETALSELIQAKFETEYMLKIIDFYMTNRISL